MIETRKCPICGTALSQNAPAGHCIKCLLKAGLEFKQGESLIEDSVTGQGEDSADAHPRILGDYELLEEIGRGGMGIVFRARQRSLNRLVALKLIRGGRFSSELEITRFRAEAEAAATLEHSNIVAIHEVGEHEGQHYLSMRLIEGQSLANLISNSSSKISTREAARFVATTAYAMHHAHQRGILHRDLKPSNILIDADGEPYVMDFGLAKRLDHDSCLTVTGATLGTPSYMSPEQAGGQKTLTTATDVYSLGTILYELLTGRPAFKGDTTLDTLNQIREKMPSRLTSINPNVDRDLETICLKCLEKDPQRRYPTAQAVGDELNRFLRNEPIVARPMNSIGKVWRWCRRKPAVASLGTAVVLMLLILAISGPIVAVRQTALAEHNRRISYASDLATAWQSWNIGNITHSIQLLERHKPRSGQSGLCDFTWRYLWNLCLPAQETPLIVNPIPAFLLAVSHDGTRFASSGPYGNVTIRNVQTHEIERQLSTGEAFAGGIAFSPNGRHLVTTGGFITLGSPGTLQVWDVATGANVFHADFGGFLGEFSPDGRWFAFGIGREIVVLDANQNWGVVRRWKAHTDSIWEVRWSLDGTRLVSAGEDHTAIVWDATSEKELCRLEGHSLGVRCAVFSADGQMVATGSGDKTVRFWDAATGVELESDQHATDVWELAWSRNGTWVASSANDGLVKLRNWNTQSNWILRGHSQSVTSLQFALNGTMLITASLDGTTRFWDLTKLPPDNALEGRAGRWSYRWSYSPIAFSSDSQSVATVNSNATDILLWNVATGVLRSRFSILTSDMRRLVPPDETTMAGIKVDDLVFVSEDRLAVACEIKLNPPKANTWCHWIAFYDLQHNILVDGFPGGAPLQLSPDRERLAMQGESRGSVKIHDLATGRIWPDPNMAHPMASNRLLALAFSPDGNALAASVIAQEGDRKLILLEAATGKPLAPLKGISVQVPIGVMEFTPDGARLITGGYNARLQVWDVRSRQLTFELPGHTSHIRSLAISPDGKTLVSGSEAGVLKFWSLEQRAELLTLRAHERSVNSLRFSPDGNTLASGGKEGQVHLWRAVPEL